MAKGVRGRSEDPKPVHIADEVGARARMLRIRRRLTLDDVAAAIGVSKGHLSRFERGQKSLSLAILIRLAHCLRSSVAELLGEPVATESSHLSRAVERVFRRAAASEGGYSFAALGRADDPRINAFMVDFAADSRLHKPVDAYHSGEEIIFVVNGAIEIELGDQKQVLSKGDLLQFAGSVKHNIRGLRKHSQALVVVIKR